MFRVAATQPATPAGDARFGPPDGIGAILAAWLKSAGCIFRETSKTGAGRAGNLDKRCAS
jgi:hypothetical protein